MRLPPSRQAARKGRLKFLYLEARVHYLDRTQAPRAVLWDAGFEYSQRGRIEPTFARPSDLFRNGKVSAYVVNNLYEQPSFLGNIQGDEREHTRCLRALTFGADPAYNQDKN